MMITSILNPFYPELAKGIEDAAMSFGYNIILCSTDSDLRKERHFTRMLRSKGVDGIIFSSVEANDPNIKPLLEDGFPFILVNRRILNRSLLERVNYIALDNFSGGYMAMEHLIRLGHRRIAVITGPPNVSNNMERTKGARKAISDYGLAFDPSLVAVCHSSKELAYEAAKGFLSMKDPPSAMFAENDYKALGVREAILESGMRIPEDVALVGFDDIAATALKGVEITTINQKKYEMGSMAVRILIERIEKSSPPRVSQVTLEPELIIRQSCGYARSGYQLDRVKL
ncbi:MAG: substrate-binding domain-containing protein [candidate division NC10 bacterium]|nr:substrate-binding domain-containing protein [candidate division NC10 bacterium]